MITYLGLLAGLLITVSFLPQVIKTFRIKSAEDLSLPTFILNLITAALWTTYGLTIKDLPLIIFNAIPFFLVMMIVIMKLKYKKHEMA